MTNHNGPMGRLFIATPLPGKMAHVLSDYARMTEPLLPGRYVSIENYHVTLAFLGETPLALTEVLEPLLAATAESFSQFKTDFTTAGFFGKRENAILWAGLQDADRIVEIAGKLRNELDACEIAYDRKPVRPHITIARKVNLRDSQPAQLPHCEGTIDSIILYESSRRNGRLTYTPLLQKYLR